MYNIKYKILPFVLLVSVFVSTLYVGIFITSATGDTAKRSISYRVQEAFGGEEFATTNELSNTVTLLKDIKLTETLNIDKGINIDLNGKTIEAESATAFNINCSDSEGLTEVEDPAAAEDSSINIYNGKIISADGYNGVDVTKGVVKLSNLEIQAKNSSPDNSAGSNAVYVKLTDSNSSVTIEASTLSCNIEDAGSYGLYMDDESNANIELYGSTVESAYIPTELIENIIGIYGANTGTIVGDANENIVTTGSGLVRCLGGSNYASSTSEAITGKVGSLNVTNTIYTVTLKQDVALKTPIRLTSKNAPLEISSYIINLNGYTISAGTEISGTTLIYVGGKESHIGPGKVEVKNGVIDCSSAPGVTSLQLGSMITRSYTSTSGTTYDFSLVEVDSTVKFTGITAVGGPKVISADTKAGDAVVAPILTNFSQYETWPHLIVDGSKLIGGKGVEGATSVEELATYGYGLNIVSPVSTSDSPNETIVDLRADSGDTYINRLFRTTIGADGGRKVLRDGSDNLNYRSGFVDNKEFFVQTRKYVQLSNDTNPTVGDINIYSPAYPRDVKLEPADNYLSAGGTEEEYVNVIIRKMQFTITIPEVVEVKDEGKHTRLPISASEVVLPNIKKVQVSVQGDEMQKNGALVLGVKLKCADVGFTTSLSIHENHNYNPINWANGGVYAVTTFDNKATPETPKNYTHLYVDGITPAVPSGNYEGKLTFTANIVDA